MRAHRVLAVVTSLALALGGCGGRPAPLDRPDGGTQADATHYDGGRHDGTIHGDAGAKCDDIANGYFALADSFNYCNVATDCTNYSVDCSIGAYAGVGACYLPVYRSADTAQLAALAQRWEQDGCPTQECHPCPAPPSLQCQGGVCVAGTACTAETCVSGPDECCGRDCDPATFQICREICPPVPPPDPLCDCVKEGCLDVWCTSDWGCPDGSRCEPDQGVCVAIPRCEQPLVGCRHFLNHCSCSWSCVDGDAEIVDCPSLCGNEEELQLKPPLCECGAGGCGMELCDPSSGDCGFGYLCNEVPGSLSYTVCTECANC
ncbi:MAG: hypothetical protein HY906_03105 [Deltaproteobacteria bacterium]|nr:hypothetical protein [Deltaproteobacteria bacterium]